MAATVAADRNSRPHDDLKLSSHPWPERRPRPEGGADCLSAKSRTIKLALADARPVAGLGT